MRAVGYVQVQAERRGNGAVRGAKIVRVTKGPPREQMPDSIVVRVALEVPESAFEPYEASGTLPEGTKAAALEVEPLAPESADEEVCGMCGGDSHDLCETHAAVEEATWD